MMDFTAQLKELEKIAQQALDMGLVEAAQASLAFDEAKAKGEAAKRAFIAAQQEIADCAQDELKAQSAIEAANAEVTAGQAVYAKAELAVDMYRSARGLVAQGELPETDDLVLKLCARADKLKGDALSALVVKVEPVEFALDVDMALSEPPVA